MARELVLNEGEVVEKSISGDYWDFLSQIRGKYTFTNQRVYFAGGFTTELEIPYSEIAFVNPCCVGGFLPIMPTGIKVTTKAGKNYKLSVLGRKAIIEMMQQHIAK